MDVYVNVLLMGIYVNESTHIGSSSSRSLRRSCHSRRGPLRGEDEKRGWRKGRKEREMIQNERRSEERLREVRGNRD